MSNEPPPPPNSYLHTWAAGEDADRLASAAKSFGLGKMRTPLKPIQHAIGAIFTDSTLTAARMHSVGTLGQDERVDDTGRLHQLTIIHRRTLGQKPAEVKYGALHDLFHIEPLEIAAEEKEEKEEEIVEDVVEGGSIEAAIFGIVKGTVGPAILYLPRGFQNSGWLVAIPAMLFATFMFVYNAYRLLECWKVERERNLKWAARLEEIRGLLDPTKEGYGSTDGTEKNETAMTSPKLLNYPELARRALGPYAFIVSCGIAMMQFGVCLTYLIFVPQNLYECTRQLFGVEVDKRYFLVAMLAIEIPLSWIRDIRKLTPFNVMATILIAYGLLSILAMAFVYGLSSSSTGRLVFADNLASLPALTEAWFLFIGTSFFMMEGSMTLVVPLQEAVYREEDKAKFPRVNATVTTYIVIFYIVFAVICCAAFGDSVRTALSASLPEGGFATSVQLAYSVAVVFTFPLQAFPAQEVACRAVLPKVDQVPLQRNILATVLTCLLGLIAVCAIDFLGNVVSILGSLFGIPLALVFPPLMHNILVTESSMATKLMNYVVVGIGFFAMGAASYATMVNWSKGAEGG